MKFVKYESIACEVRDIMKLNEKKTALSLEKVLELADVPQTDRYSLQV